MMEMMPPDAMGGCSADHMEAMPSEAMVAVMQVTLIVALLKQWRAWMPR